MIGSFICPPLVSADGGRYGLRGLSGRMVRDGKVVVRGKVRWACRLRSREDEEIVQPVYGDGSVGRALKDGEGNARLHVVFVHPQIHWNTGNIGRTCLGLGAELHLVGPLGFSLDAKQIRRAGLDYWERVRVHVYESWEEFAEGEMKRLGGERFFFTKFGRESMVSVKWPTEGNVVLVFGSEVCGLEGIEEWMKEKGGGERTIAFPMVGGGLRSFNLSTTASMALWDAFKSMTVGENVFKEGIRSR